MKKRSKISTLIAFVIMLGFTSYSLIVSYIGKKKEYRSNIHFVISNIGKTDKGTYYFVDSKENGLDFYNYEDFHTIDIKVGDSIAKRAYDKALYIYRKDSTGVYHVNLTLQPLQHYDFYDDPNFK